MKLRFIVLIAVAVLSVAIFSYFLLNKNLENNKTTVTVAKVIDGDTVELANGKRVRLIGIDSPEQGQYYYNEAKDRLKELVEGKNVILEYDVSNTDKNGRLLRYIFVDDFFVDLELVKEGYANVYIVSPDIKYSSQLLEAENFAKESGLGIWKTSSLPYSGCIEITNFHYDAKGEDNKNLNDEYVVFRNDCDFTVDFSSWTVKDKTFNMYTFAEFELESDSKVTLRSGSGNDTKSEIFWSSKYAIWNNNGDTLYLRDKEGNLILVRGYGG